MMADQLTGHVGSGAQSLQNQSYDPATQPKQPDRSLGELFAEMSREMGDLFTKEVQLAKAEAKQDVSKVGKAGAMFGAAGVAAWLGLLLLSLALAWWLDQALNTAVAFAIVGIVWALIAAVLLSIGRSRLKALEGLPQTRETLKEDVQWAKAQKN